MRKNCERGCDKMAPRERQKVLFNINQLPRIQQDSETERKYVENEKMKGTDEKVDVSALNGAEYIKAQLV